MAEHKTESPYKGAGTSQGNDQQQRADGRGEQGGEHDRKKKHDEGKYQGKGAGKHDD